MSHGTKFRITCANDSDYRRRVGVRVLCNYCNLGVRRTRVVDLLCSIVYCPIHGSSVNRKRCDLSSRHVYYKITSSSMFKHNYNSLNTCNNIVPRFLITNELVLK